MQKVGHGTSPDWWALGVLIYELLFQTTPFVQAEPEEKSVKKKDEKKESFKDERCAPEANADSLVFFFCRDCLTFC